MLTAKAMPQAKAASMHRSGRNRRKSPAPSKVAATSKRTTANRTATVEMPTAKLSAPAAAAGVMIGQDTVEEAADAGTDAVDADAARAAIVVLAAAAVIVVLAAAAIKE